MEDVGEDQVVEVAPVTGDEHHGMLLHAFADLLEADDLQAGEDAGLGERLGLRFVGGGRRRGQHRRRGLGAAAHHPQRLLDGEVVGRDLLRRLEVRLRLRQVADLEIKEGEPLHRPRVLGGDAQRHVPLVERFLVVVAVVRGLRVPAERVTAGGDEQKEDGGEGAHTSCSAAGPAIL